MGTLTDITSKASNKNLRSVDSPIRTSKDVPSQSENHVKGNFMSPTMASTKKANNATPPTNHGTRTSTPTSIRLEKASTAKWMTSAARRVGLRRVAGDGTPRSKKEGLKSSVNAVTFPDKLSTSSPSTMPDSPRPKPTPTSSFSDKPLPSPPVAQVTNSTLGEPRSLIDASEKPLQRTSPKSPRKQEEWPVLFPGKPTAPDAIRDILHQTTPEPARLVSNDQERYPRLSRSQSAASDLRQELVSRLPSTIQVQRRQLSSNSLHELGSTISATNGFDRDGADATERKIAQHSNLFPREPKIAHRLSAGAAAVEKSSTEAKSIKEPRQTRTSSLRARISAGQVIRDSPNKVLGFTDFTAEKAPLAKVSKEDLTAAANARTRPSTSFGKVFTKKPSKEFLGGTRAPAQFVAGSRRPVARRPSSRNSMQSESRASSPTFLVPSRPPPSIPIAKNDTSIRKSSIPVVRNGVSKNLDQTLSKEPPLDSSTSTLVPKTRIDGGSDFKIFEDHSNTSVQCGGNDAAAAESADPTIILESIEESPLSTFRSKRISSSSPTFGPTLKISSSADRLILGTGETNKENRSLVRKRSKDLFRAAVTNEHRNVVKNRSPHNDSQKSTTRPLSSQGFPHKGQLNDKIMSASRAEKVKSVDLGSLSIGQESVVEPGTQISEASSKSRGSSATDDPFFDAVEQRKSQGEIVEDRKEIAHTSETLDSKESKIAISPVKDSATPVSDAIPVVPVFLPKTMQQHVHKSDIVAEINRADEVKERKGGQHNNVNIQQAIDPDAPSTPDPKSGVETETPSSTFPPRSSSRMQHPVYTVNGSAKSSPISSLDQAATRLQKDISVADFAISAISDAGSFSRPVGVGANASHPGADGRTTLAEVASQRNSTAQISQKSQSSVSKGLMSNFRGLFHKRTSDASEVPNTRSTKRSGKRPTVNSHGSPSHSMSNIHPVYRPTQASINRNNATSQRTSGNSMLSTAPGMNQRTSGNSLLSPAPGTPAFNSPVPTEISTTTSLAMQILESARKESSSPKKERLLSLGKIMVDSITQARDAERAMEEAKQAARKAEVAFALCKKSVGDVTNMVQEWRADFERF
ncbi:MAG: hypothetical protein Q9209_001229 [Squamulea sp. 1 TL-2023]